MPFQSGVTIMTIRLKILLSAHLGLFFLLSIPNCCHAGTPTSDRIALEAGVKNEISVDLAQKYDPLKVLADRKCLDGRTVKDFTGEIVEYWANLECAFCGILEPVKAQRDNPDICIVVRHIPSAQYGESLKKALAFEALRQFSINAANRFWDAVVPKSNVGLPLSYEAAMHTAIE